MRTNERHIIRDSKLVCARTGVGVERGSVSGE